MTATRPNTSAMVATLMISPSTASIFWAIRNVLIRFRWNVKEKLAVYNSLSVLIFRQLVLTLQFNIPFCSKVCPLLETRNAFFLFCLWKTLQGLQIGPIEGHVYTSQTLKELTCENFNYSRRSLSRILELISSWNHPPSNKWNQKRERKLIYWLKTNLSKTNKLESGCN